MSPFGPLASGVLRGQDIPLGVVRDPGAMLVFGVGDDLVGVLKVGQQGVDVEALALEPVGECQRVHVVAEVLHGHPLTLGHEGLVLNFYRQDDDRPGKRLAYLSIGEQAVRHHRTFVVVDEHPDARMSGSLREIHHCYLIINILLVKSN